MCQIFVLVSNANSRANLLLFYLSHATLKLHEEVKAMPAIKPISDLRNYNEVLKEVDRIGTI